MRLRSISGILSCPIRFPDPNIPSARFSTAFSAVKIYDLLKKNGGNVEKTLTSVKPKLNPKSVINFLHKFHPSQSQLGLRVFVWAGLQSDYRHTPFMYGKACKLFQVRQNPKLIYDLIEDYRTQRWFVSVKTFKVVLNLCKEAKLADEALWVLRKMPEFELCADTIMYNSVIGLFCSKGDMGTAESLMKEMGLVGLYPDMITCVEMVKGFCNAGRLDDAFALYKVVREQGCEPNTVLCSVLLDGYCKNGDTDRALEFLGEMEKGGRGSSPNVVTYTSVIQRFCEKGQTLDALEVLDRMEARGCFANRVTVSCLIERFCAEGRVEEVSKLIDRVVVGGVSYGECYSSFVVSLKRNGRFEEAEKVFKTMINKGLRPDGLACSIVLKELCLIGRVLDGYQLCDQIEKIGFLSSIDNEVYSLLLVGLCQQGHSVEAAALVRFMLNKGIQLRAPYVDNIVEILKKNGDEELIHHLTGI